MNNFRFQMGLIRAYFDAYVQIRLLREAAFEREARLTLANASSTGIKAAIARAREILNMPQNLPAQPHYKKRCMELADDLYNSIGAQLTIGKHGAMGGRGNFIDNIDVPLNDAVWMLTTLYQIEQLSGEEDKLQAIDKMLHRTDPGPGGFYDNFGSITSWRRVVSNKRWSEDPGSLHTPRVSFGVGLVGREWVHEIRARGFEGEATPLAWMHQVDSNETMAILGQRVRDIGPQRGLFLSTMTIILGLCVIVALTIAVVFLFALVIRRIGFGILHVGHARQKESAAKRQQAHQRRSQKKLA